MPDRYPESKCQRISPRFPSHRGSPTLFQSPGYKTCTQMMQNNHHRVYSTSHQTTSPQRISRLNVTGPTNGTKWKLTMSGEKPGRLPAGLKKSPMMVILWSTTSSTTVSSSFDLQRETSKPSQTLACTAALQLLMVPARSKSSVVPTTDGLTTWTVN